MARNVSRHAQGQGTVESGVALYTEGEPGPGSRRRLPEIAEMKVIKIKIECPPSSHGKRSEPQSIKIEDVRVPRRTGEGLKPIFDFLIAPRSCSRIVTISNAVETPKLPESRTYRENNVRAHRAEDGRRDSRRSREEEEKRHDERRRQKEDERRRQKEEEKRRPDERRERRRESGSKDRDGGEKKIKKEKVEDDEDNDVKEPHPMDFNPNFNPNVRPFGPRSFQPVPMRMYGPGPYGGYHPPPPPMPYYPPYGPPGPRPARHFRPPIQYNSQSRPHQK